VLHGAVVSEGEPVGRRVLLRIDSDAVVLGEPAGYELRVRIRRVSPVGR
jgi:hypothetical protein